MDAMKIRCGLWKLVEDGIERYMKKHERKPVALILHPVQVGDFYRGAGRDNDLLDDVSIITSARFEFHDLVDEHGNNFDI
ncbi:hypothetical protein [Paraburkholderia bannensis]|uniref:hypothetical protein n=1 Tax=Paraburkholderia bannensis TaxID=765414 RepID=UPI002AC31D71|nr:hypothetical protein [Paraburkholderia bannensis]